MSDHELPLYKVVTPPPPQYASRSTAQHDLAIELGMDNYHQDLKRAMEDLSAPDLPPDDTTDVEVKPPPTVFAVMNPTVIERFRCPAWGFWAFFALVMGLLCLILLIPATIMYFSAPH
jgi:hypothetical protein